MFAVLPFGNRTTILTLTGAQLQPAFLNGFSPFCSRLRGRHGAVPADLGPQGHVQLHAASTPVVTGMWKTPAGISGPQTPIGPADPSGS